MITQRLISVKQPNKKSKKKYIMLIALSTFVIAVICNFKWITKQLIEKLSEPYSREIKYTINSLITGDPNRDTFYPCPKRHNISYIWLKGQIPQKYRQFVQRCKSNINILTQQDYLSYVKMWNEKFPDYQIKNYETYEINFKLGYLKKLHLYFKGGIYSDFDTVIDETCWQDVITDTILFTNMWDTEGIMIPEQNFMKVPKPLAPAMQSWIKEHIYERKGFSNRWDQCRLETCFMMLCQEHNYENSWVKK